MIDWQLPPGVRSRAHVEQALREERTLKALERIADALEALVEKPNSAQVEHAHRAEMGRLGLI
jgi:hypothetical protein